MHNQEKLEHYLHKYQLLSLFPFIKDITLRTYRKGEYLCYAGETITSFSIVIAGKCKVAPNSQDGKSIILDYLEPVSFSGDIELLNDCEALYNVKALETTTVIVISKEVFFQTVMKDIAFLKMICQKFANKLYISSTSHSQIMLYPVKHRVATLLLEEIELQKTNTIVFKRIDMAQKLGISERHLRRILNEMEEAKYLVRKQRKLICDKIKLINNYSE